MSDKENKRKCIKCGASPAEDGVKLFRVLKPGVRNLVRCEQWAKYIFPEKNVSSIDFLKKLFNEHRMLCQRHFKDEDFTDSSRKRLITTAVPCDTKHELPVPTYCFDQPGPSQPRAPLGDRSLNEVADIQPSSSRNKLSEREQGLFLKCSKYAAKICQLQKRLKAMKSKVMLKEIEEDKAVKKLSKKISPAFAILLQGQIRNSGCRLRGRRWSKEEKITALRIYKRSPTCYRLLRRLFTLPSPSTLKNLLNKVPFDVGLNEQVIKVLKNFIKTQKPSDNEFILMFDEMSLKKHLSYECKTDVIEGFQDHGIQGRSELIASYALVFMIGGIRKKVKQPIAHYLSSSFCTADRLAVLIKEVLHHCSEAGVNIAATVCDMDGVNRRALSILGATPENPVISFEGKEIISIFDTPHLLKCFRNLFIKYNIECSTNIESMDKSGIGVAKWSDIQKFYEIDNANPNFVFAPCLKKEHLNPNNKQKMKVNLAAQVFSHSVAAGMYAKISDGSLPASAAVTANVISNIDKLFDCLNSDCPDLRRGKPHATNMTATSPHKKIFSEMKFFFSTMKFVGALRKPPSQDGWIWTINGVEKLWSFLNQKYNIRSLATRRLQQDPLENLFGCIRANCGSNTNPTCGQFVAGLKTAILSSLSHVGTSGNCETDNNVIINNFDTLLSVSQPTLPQCQGATSYTHAEATALSISSAALALEIDEAVIENSAEVQACAYVCGFIAKKLPIKECSRCKNIFLSENVEDTHIFNQFKEYTDNENRLIYVSKSLIMCVEFCASLTNDFLKNKAHTKLLKKNVIEIIKQNNNFNFIDCPIHRDLNIKIIIDSTFLIGVKRFCILRNRSFSEEASASALRRKMNIITHR